MLAGGALFTVFSTEPYIRILRVPPCGYLLALERGFLHDACTDRCRAFSTVDCVSLQRLGAAERAMRKRLGGYRCATEAPLRPHPQSGGNRKGLRGARERDV